MGFMAIKVDLEKAYDCLSWNFIKDTLLDAGIPKNLIDVMYWCITTANMQLLLNGGASHSFNPSRGIHLRDSLSPYLFVLCIEKLS